MNAVIRAVTRTAIARGIKVKGIMRGYNGLLEEDIIELESKDVSDILQRRWNHFIYGQVRRVHD